LSGEIYESSRRGSGDEILRGPQGNLSEGGGLPGREHAGNPPLIEDKKKGGGKEGQI